MDRFDELSYCYTAMAQVAKEQVYEEVILGLNNLLIELDDQGCIVDEELRVWHGLIQKYEEAKRLK